jgi:hypothetical protein
MERNNNRLFRSRFNWGHRKKIKIAVLYPTADTIEKIENVLFIDPLILSLEQDVSL